MTGLTVTFALFSALTAAFSTSVQHHAAEHAPSGLSGIRGLLGHLISRPSWLVGQLLGTVSLVMHGLALHFGPLALVQPLVISGVVLAVPVRAAISGELPRARETVAVLIATGGLGTFLILSAPAEGKYSLLGPLAPLMVLGCLVIASAAIACAHRVADPTKRAFLLGGGAGILFALVAVLLKMCLTEFAKSGAPGVLGTWPVYVLVVAGLGGIASNQLAYRSGRLSSSMPILNVVDCLLALVFGYFVFHESHRHSTGVIMLEGSALIAVLAGLWLLARDAATVLGETRPLDPKPGSGAVDDFLQHRR